MTDPDSRSLLRAALVLLAVSTLRWGAGAVRGASPFEGAPVSEDHGAAAEAAAREGERRGTPLASDERIDPNRAEEADLDRLPGVGPSTAAAIVAARDTGLVFRVPEDLTGVRGIGPALVQRLADKLDLSRPPRPGSSRGAGEPRRRGQQTSSLPPPDGWREEVVDVNRADEDDLQRLPGIGPALARRIVSARAERPFERVEDLTRVPGIGPATVERLRKRVVVGVR